MTTDPVNPPPVRKPIARSVALIACGVVLAAMLLVVVVFHEPAGTLPPEPPSGPVTELIVPQQLTDPGPGDREDLIGELAAETGWIQSVDETTGAPDQRYRFSRLFPNPEGLPEGWFRMEQPEAQLFLSDRRILYLSGESALALAPSRALERGTLTGAVRIELYETSEVRAFETPDTAPLITVLTDEAEFNQELGRIDCPGPVDVRTPTASMVGRGVTIQFNDVDRVVQSLRIDQLDHVRLLARTDAPADAPEDAAAAEAGPGGPDEADDDRARQARERDRVADGDGSPREGRRARQRRRLAAEFYVLTLEGDVHVVQGDPENRREMSGDELTVIFSPDSEGLEGLARDAAPERSIPAPRPPAAAPRSLPVLLTRLAMADVGADGPLEPGPDETVITCSGAVTMAPLRDPELAPPSRRDAVLTMTGSPVRLKDAVSATDAVCAELTYRTRGQRVDLRGGPAYPLVLRSPELSASGQHFWLGQRRNRGSFVGPGEMVIGADVSIASEGVAEEGPPRPDLRVAWSEGLDLQFEAPADGSEPDGPGALREVVFRGDVVARNEQIEMDALGMTIGLAPAGPRRAAIESVTTGPATVRAVGRTGSIIASRLDLDLEVDEQGRSSPRRLIASEGVTALDEAQHLWSSNLEIVFRDPATAPDSADAASPFGTTDVERVVARDDVQVLTADGIRAFADELDIDAVTESGVLTGGNVVIAREDLLLERGSRVEFDRVDGIARWRGAGTARVLAAPLDVAAVEPLDRPSVPADAATQMRASWTSGLTYDGSFNEGAGAIDLFGDVQAALRPAGDELSTIEGQHLTVELALAGDPAADRSLAPAAGVEEASSGRTISRFIARHRSRLERRTWMPDDPDRKPDVFFVAGEYIEYDDVGGTALVIGEGTLLIRDLPDGPPVSAGSTGGDAAPFSGQGTTMFLFGDRLELTTIGADPVRYRVVMTGGVQGSHQSIEGRTAAVTGERFDAIFERRADDAARPDGAGSAMELRRLAGRGAIYFRTAERRVECDEFDYDLIAGLSQLRARPGRLVSVSSSNGEQMSAESIEWNMVTDSIRVRRTLGSVDQDR
ncbi:MAG: hypothetical protein ACYTJ0_07420 [Planctomycetota bacterium]|jgi:hypothetical protein